MEFLPVSSEDATPTENFFVDVTLSAALRL
jgi:hypothetical protein